MVRRSRSKSSSGDWKKRMINLNLSIPQREAVIENIKGTNSQTKLGYYLQFMDEGWAIKMGYSEYHGAVACTATFPDKSGHLEKKMVVFQHPNPERCLDILIFVVTDLYANGYFAEGANNEVEDW